MGIWILDDRYWSVLLSCIISLLFSKINNIPINLSSELPIKSKAFDSTSLNDKKTSENTTILFNFLLFL